MGFVPKKLTCRQANLKVPKQVLPASLLQDLRGSGGHKAPEGSFGESINGLSQAQTKAAICGGGSDLSVPFSWEAVPGNRGTDHPEEGQIGKNNSNKTCDFQKTTTFLQAAS